MSADLVTTAALLPGLFIALSAGLLSFLSPCVLPIVPPYLAYMGGVSVNDLEGKGRGRVVMAALFFVLGLSVVFLLMGASASALGRLFLSRQELFVTIAGIITMIFGAHFIGVFRLGFLDREARMEAGDHGGSALGAFVLGLAFAFGWTPCLGPVLGTLIGFAATQGNVMQGTALLAAYAVGLGVPFLLVAIFFPRLKGVMAWMKRHMDRVEKVSGLLLWTVGLMLLTGQFTQMSNWLLDTFPGLATLG
ncbi:MAG: cytochrome C biogenesis protein [Rhodobacterales bacterium]|nr:MAG: cytochrome C biogenesis protein [Rhodobacterales bacterium]